MTTKNWNTVVKDIRPPKASSSAAVNDLCHINCYVKNLFIVQPDSHRSAVFHILSVFYTMDYSEEFSHISKCSPPELSEHLASKGFDNSTCCKLSGNYSSLTKHLRHVHAMKTSSTSQAHLVCAQNSSSGSSTSHHLHDPPSRSSEFDSGSLISESLSFESLSTSKVVETKDFLAQVMLELKAKHNVSNAALDFLTDKLREGFSELGTNEEAPSDDEFIRSDRDSLFFKTHSLFSKYPHALRIQFYYDDVETVNALGSKTKKHEIGMFCFRILNLPMTENSKLANIFPIAMVTSVQLKNNGFDFIFTKFMEEIKELESQEGMLLNIPGLPNFRVRGTIAAVCADTKGAHELGGFLSPSANKFCRLCLIDRKDIRFCSCINPLIMRNRTNYENAVKESSLCAANSRQTGVIKSCLLNLSKSCIVQRTVHSSFYKFFEELIFCVKDTITPTTDTMMSKLEAIEC
uniref:C2H2-type domain-containing protein n=1 Tax=Daphnia galeata TaxID=27404 RepID=A0A8J2WL15_9CRUS|nr:unnamed protein product [Daphnia galeata]